MKTEDAEALGRQRTKPSKIKARFINRPVRTAHIFVHHYNSIHNTVTQRQFLFIFPFLQTNITSLVKNN